VRWSALGLLALMLTLAFAPSAQALSTQAAACTSQGCGTPARPSASVAPSPISGGVCIDRANCGGGAALGGSATAGQILALVAAVLLACALLRPGLGRILTLVAGVRRGVTVTLQRPPQPV
jgi:hypothetical protein